METDGDYDFGKDYLDQIKAQQYVEVMWNAGGDAFCGWVAGSIAGALTGCPGGGALGAQAVKAYKKR